MSSLEANKVGKGNTAETVLKKFMRSCSRDGVMSEIRKREHYEKPSVKRKNKLSAARRRLLKNKKYRRNNKNNND